MKYYVAMKAIYPVPSHKASFGVVNALYHAAKGKLANKAIQKWLWGVNSYKLHKPVRINFPTNRMDQQWQTDLVDLSCLQKHNQGFRYLLTCTDILSTYTWAIPLKIKRGVEIVKVFRSIFSTIKPKFLQSDVRK